MVPSGSGTRDPSACMGNIHEELRHSVPVRAKLPLPAPGTGRLGGARLVT